MDPPALPDKLVIPIEDILIKAIPVACLAALCFTKKKSEIKANMPTRNKNDFFILKGFKGLYGAKITYIFTTPLNDRQNIYK